MAWTVGIALCLWLCTWCSETSLSHQLCPLSRSFASCSGPSSPCPERLPTAQRACPGGQVCLMNPWTSRSLALVSRGDPHPGRPLQEGPAEGSGLFPLAPLLPRAVLLEACPVLTPAAPPPAEQDLCSGSAALAPRGSPSRAPAGVFQRALPAPVLRLSSCRSLFLLFSWHVLLARQLSPLAGASGLWRLRCRFECRCRRCLCGARLC